MDEDRRIPGWVLPVLGVLTVIALVVFGLNREPAVFDPDTPAGTVQEYIAALVEGDFETAASFWAKDGCLPESMVPTSGSFDISASLDRVEVVNGEEATVVIAITENSADPVGGLYEHEEWFHLVRQGGNWRINQPSWPYYDQVCEEAA
ncbi:MAG: hypothetical protein ACRDX9_13430 [Acidimicrobiia bacterium]